MTVRHLLLVGGFLLTQMTARAQAPATRPTSAAPLEAVRRVADKMLRTTPFAYQLAPVKPTAAFNDIAFLNLGHSFGLGRPAVAYALTALVSPRDTTLTLQISHSDGLKVWVNQAPVYERRGDGPAVVTYRERSVALAQEFVVPLKRGANTLLLKSETAGSAWSFYLRPKDNLPGLQLRVDALPLVSPALAQFANWLVVGPFPNPSAAGRRAGLATDYEPEQTFETAQLYTHGGQAVTWSIPRLELAANGFGSTMAWGDNNFSWNYHAGGTAWAMGQLGAYTGEEKYTQYSRRYCDFFLAKRPYLAYQKYEAGGLGNGDARIWESHMLDFTGAPGLAYQYWLEQPAALPNRAGYQAFYQELKHYVLHEQVRLPQGNFTRETPHRYTTWADDMYMGIPFVVHAAQLAPAAAERKALLAEAARQLFAFNAEVFDPQYNLYRQTQYSDRKVKIPFWSRANGWGLWATAELLTYLPAGHPQRARVLAHFRRHVNGLRAYQDPKTGFWHNLLDKPDSYPETSGTAIFVMAMAKGVRLGWLDRRTYTPVVLKGWQALASVIEADGTLHGTCVGTNMSENIQAYYTRPVADDDTHGIFPVLFAGMEVDKMLRPASAKR